MPTTSSSRVFVNPTFMLCCPSRFANVLRTVVGETTIPSCFKSPTIRWQPHRGFSRARRTTSSRTSRPTDGRRRRTYVQRLATSRRRQSRSVAGLTIEDRHVARGMSRPAAARNIRSDVVSVGRPVRRRKDGERRGEARVAYQRLITGLLFIPEVGWLWECHRHEQLCARATHERNEAVEVLLPRWQTAGSVRLTSRSRDR